MRTPGPTQQDRTELDRAIGVLVRLGDDVTLDDFRTANLEATQRTNQRVRIIAFYGSLTFLALTLWMYGSAAPSGRLDFAVLGFAAGGLGATVSLFVSLLKLNPDEPFKAADEFDMIGRIIVGCALSTMLTPAIAQNVAPELMSKGVVTRQSVDATRAAALALAPFLFGYSTEFSLRLLDRTVQTMIAFFGGDDRRPPPTSRRTRRRGRKAP